jgi:mannose-6-phosphate isomerase
MQVVRGHLQSYDWGPVDGLQPWTPPTGGPQAELWFGTHPNGPSPLRDGAGRARGAMPVLLKLLAAARPLSIQIHPPAALAAERFARQQQDPRAQHLLSDPHGKAEILVALQPFAILEGFRDPEVSARVMQHVGPAVEAVTRALRDHDLPGAVRCALALPRATVAAAAPLVPDAVRRAGLPQAGASIMAQVVACYPDDPGVFVAALLQGRTLQPGEAVYVDPGTVHAYVRGLGLEVMTSSDNVLRLGLTRKDVAVDAALAAVDLHAEPHPCAPHRHDGMLTYAPPGAPFAVDLLEDTRTRLAGGTARIVACLTGRAEVGEVALAPGDAALLQDDAAVTVTAEGRTVVARDATPTPGPPG